MGYTPTPYNETFSTAAALRSTSFGERPLRAPLAAPSLPPGAPHFFLSATESNMYFLHFFIYQFHDLLALMGTVFDYLFLAGVCIGIEADSAQFWLINGLSYFFLFRGMAFSGGSVRAVGFGNQCVREK